MFGLIEKFDRREEDEAWTVEEEEKEEPPENKFKETKQPLPEP